MPISGLEHHREVRTALNSRRYGNNAYVSVIESILCQRLDCSVLSTAEHLAPFNYASNLSFVIPQLALAHCEPSNRSVILLPCSLVPLDNDDYPRGFFAPANDKTERWNVFPKRLRHCAPAMIGPAHLGNFDPAGSFQSAYPSLAETFTRSFLFETYASQLAAAMTLMGHRWFDRRFEVEFDVVPLEEVARSALVALIRAEDPVVSALLFSAEVRAELHRRLNGVTCAWGLGRGSFLFWTTRGGRPQALNEDSGTLVGTDYSLPLTVASVLTALLNREICPGVFLSLTVVSYLPGIPVCSGPTQSEYYPKMIDALNTLTGLRRCGDLSVLGYLSIVVKPEFFLDHDTGHTITRYGTGLALQQKPLSPAWFLRQLDRCSFHKSAKASQEWIDSGDNVCAINF